MNDDKREPVLTRTRHLGFGLDLTGKVLSVTEKHKRKIIAQFNRFGGSEEAGSDLHQRSAENVGFADLD